LARNGGIEFLFRAMNRILGRRRNLRAVVRPAVNRTSRRRRASGPEVNAPILRVKGRAPSAEMFSRKFRRAAHVAYGVTSNQCDRNGVWSCPRGEIVRRGGRRSQRGPTTCWRLLVGSEGTLALCSRKLRCGSAKARSCEARLLAVIRTRSKRTTDARRRRYHGFARLRRPRAKCWMDLPPAVEDYVHAASPRIAPRCSNSRLKGSPRPSKRMPAALTESAVAGTTNAREVRFAPLRAASGSSVKGRNAFRRSRAALPMYTCRTA